jgi:hypothetical protein
MSRLALKLREELPTDVFTDTEVVSLVDGTPARRYGLVKRAIADGDLIQVRRGVYSLGKRFQRQPLNLFELAQKVYPLSYIGLESALSYHGWIPEAAYTVTSVCVKRSASFETPVGLFSFTRLARFNFIGVDRVKEGNSIFLMSGPTKALVDFFLAHKIDVKNPIQLLDSLRIDREYYRQIDSRQLLEIADVYQSARVTKFVKALRQSTVL